MANELHQELLTAIKDRSNWESRQAVWYAMRHDGLKRRSKPWPNAADMHFPLIDESIEKLTPFYYAQVYSSEVLATFTALQQQLGVMAAQVAAWFDFVLKRRTEFETAIVSVIDSMLMSGRGILKIYWDTKEDRLKIESVDPVYLIVPQCKLLTDADMFAHASIVTKRTYLRDGRYDTDKDLLVRICGGSEANRPTDIEESQRIREGLTHINNKNEILIWEVYEKTPSGWTVHTYSPTAPDRPLRAPFALTTTWQGKAVLPFASRFIMEVKEGRFYSPRGISERLAPFEAYLCRVWNDKCDNLTLTARPLFTAENALPNMANITMNPGSVLPGNLKAVQMPAPPVSLDMEMQQTRQIATQRIHMPDAVSGQEQLGKNKGGFPTATQVDYERALASTGVDFKGKIFRLGLTEAYQIAYATLLRHNPEQLDYLAQDELKMLPGEAMAEAYQVEPGGSTDAWNKQVSNQRAVGRFQTFVNHPNINQEELVKDVLSTDDPRLVRRLFLQTNLKGAIEAEDEAHEIVIMQSGYPAAVTPAEDHQTRLRILFGKLQQLQLMGQPVDPMFKQRLTEHIAQHLKLLAQQNPQLAKQIMGATEAMDSAAQPAPGLPPGQPEQQGPEMAGMEQQPSALLA